MCVLYVSFRPSYTGPTQNKQCPLLLSYLSKIDEDKHPSPLCPLCKSEQHTTTHLFSCTNMNTQLQVTDLWTASVEVGNLLVEWRGHQSAAGPDCVETDVGPLHHYRRRGGAGNNTHNLHNLAFKKSQHNSKVKEALYFQPSTTTCCHLQTNTVSEPDTLTNSRLLQLTSPHCGTDK